MTDMTMVRHMLFYCIWVAPAVYEHPSRFSHLSGSSSLSLVSHRGGSGSKEHQNDILGSLISWSHSQSLTQTNSWKNFGKESAGLWVMSWCGLLHRAFFPRTMVAQEQGQTP